MSTLYNGPSTLEDIKHALHSLYHKHPNWYLQQFQLKCNPQ
jgi:hypothetical protein